MNFRVLLYSIQVFLILASILKVAAGIVYVHIDVLFLGLKIQGDFLKTLLLIFKICHRQMDRSDENYLVECSAQYISSTNLCSVHFLVQHR